MRGWTGLQEAKLRVLTAWGSSEGIIPASVDEEIHLIEKMNMFH